MNVINFSEAARELDMSHQRFSRLIKGMDIPYQRSGYTLLFDRAELPRLRAAAKKGKKKKKAKVE